MLLFNLLPSQHINQSDFAIAKEIKPGRYLNPGAFDQLESYNEAVQKRARMKQHFFLQAKGKMSYEQAQDRWSDWVNNHDLFNPKTHELNSPTKNPPKPANTVMFSMPNGDGSETVVPVHMSRVKQAMEAGGRQIG